MDERESRMDVLYERLNEEYEQFREGILRLSKAGIMDSAFQINARDDIIILFDTHRFELPDIETLLTLENPLEEIYLEWRDFDGSSMDDLFSCVDRVIRDTRERLGQNAPEEAATSQPEQKTWADMNTQEWTFDTKIKQEYHLALLEGEPEINLAMLEQAFETLKAYAFTDPIDREVLMTYSRPLETIALKMELEMTDAEGGIGLIISERRDNLQFFHSHFDRLPNFMQTALRRFESHCANVIGEPIKEMADYEKWSFQAKDNADEQEPYDELEQ